MLTKIMATLRQAALEQEATGTFADGAFPLTAAEQLAFDRQYSLRSSYGRDHLAARKIEQGAATFA